jgi:hypothetical protein
MIEETYAAAKEAKDYAVCTKLIELLVKMRVVMHPVKPPEQGSQDPSVKSALRRINGTPA